MNIDYKDIADNILCGVDYDIYKDDCNEMDNELRDEIESMLIIEFKAPIDKLTEENKRMRESLIKSQTDIKSIIDHLFSLGLDEAWAVCKLNDMLDDVNYVLNGK